MDGRLLCLNHARSDEAALEDVQSESQVLLSLFLLTSSK